jgi:UDP-N-acetylmuramyl pentapeptide synthase
LVRPGGGSALPGLVLSKLAPNLVYKTLGSFEQGLVIVTGTAGKSTTTKMLVAIARAHGLDVFTNPSTANIEQGFFSTIIKQGNLFGQVPGSIAIIEMDEGHAAQVVANVKPKFSVILNVFEDQLDRFIDPALVRDKLLSVAKATTGTVLLNADDQNCLLIAAELSQTETKFFGIASEVSNDAKSKLNYAPTYLAELPAPAVLAEVVRLQERNATVSIAGSSVSFDLPSRGLHFALDAVAALTTAKSILGESFDLVKASKVLNELPPVFSRGEIREVNGEQVEFILVQNPPSMQLNLDNLSSELDQVFFAIGRDVHDPSWMWTVDLANLKHVSVVTGFNYADAALLLSYNEIPVESVEADYFKAIDEFFKLPRPRNGIKTVIYSADSMRRLRRHMGFTDPEDVQRV